MLQIRLTGFLLTTLTEINKAKQKVFAPTIKVYTAYRRYIHMAKPDWAKAKAHCFVYNASITV